MCACASACASVHVCMHEYMHACVHVWCDCMHVNKPENNNLDLDRWDWKDDPGWDHRLHMYADQSVSNRVWEQEHTVICWTGGCRTIQQVGMAGLSSG